MSMSCVMLAAAAATQAWSSGVGRLGFVVLTGSAVALVPAAVLWLRCSLHGPYPRVFCVLADVGITAGLTVGFASSFTALAGVALFAPVAFIANLCGSGAVWRTHVIISVSTMVALSTHALAEGSDVFSVIARVLGQIVVLAVPVAFSTLYRRVLADVQRQRIDPRSGLYNRVGLETAADDEPGVVIVAMSVRVEERRDTGPEIGPRATTVPAALLRAALSDALLARTGPSEYMAIVWVADRCAATAVTDRWLSAMDTLAMSPSSPAVWRWGVAVVDRDLSPMSEDSVTWTVQRAVAAAELRRRSRTTRHAVGSEPVSSITAADIAAVMESGGPEIVFQPIFDTRTRELAGFEALSRFPTGSPDTWFAAAGRLGVGAPLERAAAANALREAHLLPGHAFVSINVSPAALLAQPGIAAMLVAHADNHPLVVELTENARIDKYAILAGTVTMLRDAGIRIALDDVGAGYAGLQTVLAVQPDLMKLDASLIRGVDADAHRGATVTALISIAEALDARCVCEGIETRSELDFCVQAGADLLQGYALGRPSPAHEAASRRWTTEGVDGAAHPEPDPVT